MDDQSPHHDNQKKRLREYEPEGSDETFRRRSARTNRKTGINMDSYLEPKSGEPSIGTTPRPKIESTDLKEKAHRLLTIAQAEFGLKMQLKDSPLRDQIHIFDTLFFRRLDAGRGKGCDYHAVKNWTSTLDIFSKQFIIVPIREQGIWYIAIICFPKHILEIDCTEPQPLSTVPSERTSILILDPYEGDHSRTIRILREYHLAEALERHEKMVNFIKDMPMFWPVGGKHLSVGLESEWCDGGIHLLHYTRMFFANPLEIIALPPDARQKRGEEGNLYNKLWGADPTKGGDDRTIFWKKINEFSTEWLAFSSP